MIKMKEATVLLTFIVTVTIVTGLIEEQPMPNLLCDCFCNNNVTHHRADLVHYKCIQRYLARTYDQRWHVNVSTSAINYIKSLEREMAQTLLKRRPKRQTPFLYHGYRKEIRTLTTAERQQFFRAVNALKSDTSVFPNAYEAIAAFHSGASLPAAHGGPAFCPWHRYYTYLFESALRRKDRRVTLCYWDSSKDSNLPDPINSNIWGPDFLGNANGAVVTGPFAGWRISGGAAPLTRNFASGVNLFPSWGLRNIYSKTRNSEIMEPTAPSDSNLETFHNTVHAMIGGTMLDSNISPHDPVFFLHHGFIDCVWERFRQGQVKKIGI